MITNYAEFNYNDLLILFGEENLNNLDKYFTCKGVSTDTRTLQKGNLFIALKGENFDAHHKLDEAYEKGASACIISNPEELDNKKAPYIKVANTLKALGVLANYHRNRFDHPVIAVAGSNGKTTTKDMIGAVLAKKYQLIKTEGNLNNLIGTPLTLLRLSNNYNMAVVEIGTNMPGEIHQLCEIVAPTHGIITNIGKEHLEGFIDLDGVELEETFLYGYLMKKRNFAFVNIDDSRLSKYAELLDKRVTYGQGDAEVKGKFEFDENIHPIISITFNENTITAKMKTLGMGSALNALAASSLGFFFDVEPKKIKEALEEFEIPKGKGYGRMVIEKVGDYTILNDCYNANPPSMEIALDSLIRYPYQGAKIAVLGDMKELGENSINEHEEIIHSALQADIVLLYGEDFFEAAQRFTSQKIICFDDKQKLVNYIKDNYSEAAILVKGSRGCAMETIINQLSEHE